MSVNEKSGESCLYGTVAPTGWPDPAASFVLQQAFVNLRRGHPGKLPPPDAGLVERLHPGDRRLLDEMLSCSVVGSAETVRLGLEAFAARTGADELMLASQIYDHEARLRSYELAAGLPVPSAALVTAGAK
jgi:alkanesulfonate monooxygenase SsuD/methylene tetrahydromethanopterin reductase-like flavin-dependent oxidoreductase (luciferase family)